MALDGNGLLILKEMRLKNKLFDSGQKDFSIYIHIPFCRRKCPYCHFYVIKNEADLYEPLYNALIEDMKADRERTCDKHLVSIYFGGGTPSLFPPELIKKLIDAAIESALSHAPDIEITLEVNPEDVSFEKIKLFQKAGINRISMGIQTLSAPLLKKIGRRHSPEDALNAIDTIIAAGIDNISVDLMLDLPSESFDQVESTLDAILQKQITHISLYNLILEEGSAFERVANKIKKRMPQPHESLMRWEWVIDKLSHADFVRYEISAFSKKDLFRSRHNLGYWQARPFLGYGPSAFSYWNGTRFSKTASIKEYINCPGKLDFEETLSPTASQAEQLAVALRVLDGTALSLYQIDARLDKQIKQLICDALLEQKEDLLRLTLKGRLFYDLVGTALVEA